jgi:hypothetical protein
MAPVEDDSQPGTPYTIIRSFLESSASDTVSGDAAAAAVELARHLTTNNCSLALNHLFHPANYVFRIFSTLIDLAVQIPPNNVYHQRLASLLRVLKDQPQPPSVVSQTVSSIWGFGEFRWEKVPTFGMQQGELFDYKNRLERPNAPSMAGTNAGHPKNGST